MNSNLVNQINVEDQTLTGNPQLSYFKCVYRRHTPFYKFTREIRPFATDTINFGREVRYKTLREGDLLGKMFFEVDIKGKQSIIAGDGSETASTQKQTVTHFGNSMFKSIELRILNNTIVKHTSQWLQVHSELTSEKYLNNSYKNLDDASPGGLYTDYSIGTSREVRPSFYDRTLANNSLIFGHNDSMINYYKKFNVPLKFWFNNDCNQLPLLAMPEVTFVVEIEELNTLKGHTDITMELQTLKLWGEFFNLSEDEKRRFRNNRHEYLIEQLQVNETSITDTTLVSGNNFLLNPVTINPIPFNHPIKYFAWAVANPGPKPFTDASIHYAQGPCYFISMCRNTLLGNCGKDEETRQPYAKLMINNYNITEEHNITYYTRQLINQYCKFGPILDRIGMYSFALRPFDIEPSGTLNFSTFINSTFELSIGNNRMSTIRTGAERAVADRGGELTLYLFAVNYNILRIENNTAGIKYMS